MARAEGRRSVRPMFRTIVTGYDEPDHGAEAIALAELLRDPREGTLLLTSAYSLAPIVAGAFVVPGESDALRDEAHKMLAAARENLTDTHRVRIRALASESPARVLREVAEAEQADLVVVGSSHRGALGRVLLGTTAENVVLGAPCAVAVAPRGYRGGEIHRIAVAYDGSPEADAALLAAESVALEVSAALIVYCVVEPASPTAGMIAAGTGAEWPSRAAKGHARHLLYAVADNAPDGVNPETLLLHGEPAAEIAARVDGVADLLFVGSRGHGPLRRALLGSVSRALLRDAGCPVVVTPRSAVAPRPAPRAARAGRA
jgi:nucleotide-binding universal stress UspA family protein